MIEVSPQEGRARVQQGASLIDVREQNEFDEVHAEGATLIPLSQFGERYGEIPRDQEVVVICRSGGRSARAVEFLEGQGYRAVNLQGGTLQWLEAGLPVQRGEP